MATTKNKKATKTKAKAKAKPKTVSVKAKKRGVIKTAAKAPTKSSKAQPQPSDGRGPLKIVMVRPGEKPEVVSIPNTIRSIRSALGSTVDGVDSSEVSVGPWACELWYPEGTKEPKLEGKNGLSTSKNAYFFTSRGRKGVIESFTDSGAMSVAWALRSSWSDWSKAS